MSGLRKAGHRVAVCLGMGLLVLSVGACSDGSSNSAPPAERPATWGYPTSWVSVRADETTAVDTYEAPGAAKVPLLGVTVANPHEKEVRLSGLRLRGEGDLWGLETVRIALDLDRDGSIGTRDPKLWTGPFGGVIIETDDWTTTLEPWSTVTVLVDGDMTPGTPEGTTFRVWMDSKAGDVDVRGCPEGGEVRGRADSGWRIIGGPATAILGREIAAIPFPLAPGDEGLPAVAARIRASTVDALVDFRIGLDGFGTGTDWDRVTWDVWIDGDADGAVDVEDDQLVIGGLQIDPDVGSVIDVVESVPPGGAVNLLVSANLDALLPENGGFYGITLTLVTATGLASGPDIPVAGDPAIGGVRVGNTDLVVAVGGQIAVLDPDNGVTLAMPEDPDNTEGIVTADPNGRWAATATPPPRVNYPRDPLIILDLGTGRVDGILRFDGFARNLVPHPDGDRLYMGVESWGNEIFEVILPDDLTGSFINPMQRPWMFLGGSNVFDLDPTGRRAYVFEWMHPGGSIMVYDTETSDLLDTLLGGETLTDLKVTADGSRVVVRRISGTPFAAQFLRSVPVDGSPWMEIEIGSPGQIPFEFSLSSDGAKVYVSQGDTARVLDAATLTEMESFTFDSDVISLSGGKHPDRLVVLTANRDLYVVDPGESPRITASGIGNGACTIGVVR